MTLATNPQLGNGGTGMQGSDPKSAAYMIKELQGLTTVVVAGAGANTNIAIAGIKTTDTIQSCLEFAAGVPANRTSVTSITSAGNIQLTASTTGSTLVVTYFKKP